MSRDENMWGANAKIVIRCCQDNGKKNTGYFVALVLITTAYEAVAPELFLWVSGIILFCGK